jgi:hypothetical protein
MEVQSEAPLLDFVSLLRKQMTAQEFSPRDKKIMLSAIRNKKNNLPT